MKDIHCKELNKKFISITKSFQEYSTLEKKKKNTQHARVPLITE